MQVRAGGHFSGVAYDCDRISCFYVVAQLFDQPRTVFIYRQKAVVVLDVDDVAGLDGPVGKDNDTVKCRMNRRVWCSDNVGCKVSF